MRLASQVIRLRCRVTAAVIGLQDSFYMKPYLDVVIFEVEDNHALVALVEGDVGDWAL